jgi:hypothetical protein
LTKIINLFGGPGVGKSTTATGVFSQLKQKGISCEYVSEYAKDLVWDDITGLLNNQIHVFAEQLRRQMRLVGKVDYVITDSPLLLSCVYWERWWTKGNQFFSPDYCYRTLDYFVATFEQFENVNWYIERNKEYVQKGRIQTEDEAKEVDKQVKEWLDKYAGHLPHGFPYTKTHSKASIEDIVNSICPPTLLVSNIAFSIQH